MLPGPPPGGRFPLDPYKRTNTTFRPYGAVGLVAAIAFIVGIGILVNDSRSEPGAPNVEGQTEVAAARAE